MVSLAHSVSDRSNRDRVLAQISIPALDKASQEAIAVLINESPESVNTEKIDAAVETLRERLNRPQVDPAIWNEIQHAMPALLFSDRPHVVERAFRVLKDFPDSDARELIECGQLIRQIVQPSRDEHEEATRKLKLHNDNFLIAQKLYFLSLDGNQAASDALCGTKRKNIIRHAAQTLSAVISTEVKNPETDKKLQYIPRILGGRSEGRAFNVVLAAAKQSKFSCIQNSAVTALGGWKNPLAHPVLMDYLIFPCPPKMEAIGKTWALRKAAVAGISGAMTPDFARQVYRLAASAKYKIAALQAKMLSQNGLLKYLIFPTLFLDPINHEQILQIRLGATLALCHYALKKPGSSSEISPQQLRKLLKQELPRSKLAVFSAQRMLAAVESRIDKSSKEAQK